MKKLENNQENQRQKPQKPDLPPARRKEISADPGEFRASALESNRSLEDGRDD